MSAEGWPILKLMVPGGGAPSNVTVFFVKTVSQVAGVLEFEAESYHQITAQAILAVFSGDRQSLPDGLLYSRTSHQQKLKND